MLCHLEWLCTSFNDKPGQNDAWPGAFQAQSRELFALGAAREQSSWMGRSNHPSALASRKYSVCTAREGKLWFPAPPGMLRDTKLMAEPARSRITAIYSLEWEDRSYSLCPSVLAHSPAFSTGALPCVLAGMEPAGRGVWRVHISPGEGRVLPVRQDPSPESTSELGSAGR